MSNRIIQRHDKAANWELYNPVLAEGELGFITDQKNRYKIGDGITAWKDLPLQGFNGNIVNETGDDEGSVMSQKGVTQKLTELESKTDILDFDSQVLVFEPQNDILTKKRFYAPYLKKGRKYRFTFLNKGWDISGVTSPYVGFSIKYVPKGQEVAGANLKTLVEVLTSNLNTLLKDYYDIEITDDWEFFNIELRASEKVYIRCEDITKVTKLDEKICQLNSDLSSYSYDIVGEKYKGYLLFTSTGILRSHSDYEYTGFISVKEGEELLCSCCVGGNRSDNSEDATGIAGYNANYEYVMPILDFSVAFPTLYLSGRQAIINYKITIPSGVRYIRGCSAYKGSFGVEIPLSIKSNIKPNVLDISGYTPIYVGDLGIFGFSASGIVDRTDRASGYNICALPYGDKSNILVSLQNSNIAIGIRFGATATNLNNNLYWYRNGEIITPPSGANYYRVGCAFGNLPTEEYLKNSITMTEDLVSTIGLKLYAVKYQEVEKPSSDILSSARLFFSKTEMNSLKKYATIGHTSDCHGDYQRVQRFINFCEDNDLDIGCITGDIVSYKPSDDIKWFNELINNSSAKIAICTGNHDVYDDSKTDSDIYDFMFDDIATKIGNTTGKTWYYIDIASKKIRVISVNLYQYGGSSRWYTHFADDQLSWLVSTLARTPTDYGVIILEHAAQVSLDNAKDPNYPTFFQDVRKYNNTHNHVNGTPIYDIIDAFIEKTTLSKTYTQTGNPSSLSISADFSNVASGVEFIAHLTGHFHQDSICYVPNTKYKQLMLNVICTNAIYGGEDYPYLADTSDQGRNNIDMSQDAFNVYVIDRDNKQVKIIRVGTTTKYDMSERKYMAIPYSD